MMVSSGFTKMPTTPIADRLAETVERESSRFHDIQIPPGARRLSFEGFRPATRWVAWRIWV